MAGASVQPPAPVEGDLIVAGAILNLDKPVSGDVMAAGAIINITAGTGDDVRAAGASVTLTGDVGDDVLIAGGSITIDAASTIGGSARLAGNTVTVAGSVSRALMLSGSAITISGAIGGDVEIIAESIEVEPGAVIKGNLTYSAPHELTIQEGAVIEGDVDRQEFALGDVKTWQAAVIGRFKFYLSLAIAAIVLFLLVPRSGANVVARLREGPLKSFGLGFVVLVTTPVAALILLFSGIGVPLALAALAIFGFVLIAGLLAGVGWIGDSGFRFLDRDPDQSAWMRVWSIVAGAVVLMLVKLIPYVGGWAFFAVMLLGIGALSLHSYRLIERQRNSPAST